MSSSRTEQQDIIRDTIDRLFQSSRGRSIRFPRDGGRVPRKWSRRTLISKPPPQKKKKIAWYAHLCIWYCGTVYCRVRQCLEIWSEARTIKREAIRCQIPKNSSALALGLPNFVIVRRYWSQTRCGREAATLCPRPKVDRQRLALGGRRICCRRYKLCSDLSSQPKRPGDLNIHLHLHLFRSKIQ